jgi:DNA transformation protein
MAVSQEFVEYVRDQLRPFGAIAARRMFGGTGLFRDGMMFGLVHDDALYFRTDAANVGAFTSAGMAPFTYTRAGREVALGYFAVPAEVIDEPDRLAQWAAGACAAAARRKSA